jgi:hypothetical protein
MVESIAFGVPLGCLVFLGIFAGFLLPWEVRAGDDKKDLTTEQREQISGDYRTYLKVMMVLVVVFAYVRFERMGTHGELAREALHIIGGIGMLVMVTYCVFLICRLGAKVRRRPNIDWNELALTQEFWAGVSMWVFSSGLWIAAWEW